MFPTIDSDEVCYHPIFRPRVWGEKKPAPCKMKRCTCGTNVICPVCGNGRFSTTCTCNKPPQHTQEIQV